MKKNSNAFTVIKSLTMSEKRYFKIFSERHTIGEQNKYVALFDLLDKNSEENDQDIKKQLNKVKINTDYLSADKNYLYHLILKSLNDFHDSRTYNLQIKETLLSIEILFHKGLYKECLKQIEFAEKLASECENFQLMVDILMWKKKCSGYSLGLKKAAEVNLSIDKYILLLNNYKKITDLYYESNLIQSNNEKYPKKEVVKRLEEILKSKELQSEKNALSFSAKIFFHLIYSNYYYSIDNKQKELNHLQKLVDVIKDSKTYALENPLDFVSIYNRLLASKKFFSSESFFEDIDFLKEFGTKIAIRKEIVVERIFIHTSTHELEYYLINNDFQRALVKIKEIEKEIIKRNLNIEPYHIIYFYYLHISTLVFTGHYHKALKFINMTLNDFDFTARPQVYLRIEVLNAIVHYELKNYSLVTSIAKQILRKNNTKNVLLPIEEKVLNALIKIAGLKYLNIKNETDILNELLDSIEKAQAVSTDQSGLINNYQKWVIAKVKRKTVSELFK